MPEVSEIRRFHVQARHVEAHHAQVLMERSFEAAAVAYVEDLHAVGDESEMSVIVRELDSGHEHCFRIDLASGEAVRLPRSRGRFVDLGAMCRLLLFACLLHRPWVSGIPGRNVTWQGCTSLQCN